MIIDMSGNGGGGGGEYVLPKASETRLGGIKVGENLEIDANGVLSAVVPEPSDNTKSEWAITTNSGVFMYTESVVFETLDGTPLCFFTWEGYPVADDHYDADRVMNNSDWTEFEFNGHKVKGKVEGDKGYFEADCDFKIREDYPDADRITIKGGESGPTDILKARTEFPENASNGDVVAIKGENIITIKKEDWVGKMGIANNCPILDANGTGLIFCEFWGDVNFGWEWRDYQDLVTNEWTEYTQNGTTISAKYDKDGDGILQIKVISGDYSINPSLSLIVNDSVPSSASYGVYQYFADAKTIKWFQFNLALDYFRAQMDTEGINRWVFNIANTNEIALSTDGWSWNIGPDKDGKTWILGNEIGDDYVYLYDNVRAKMGDDMLILDVVLNDWQYIDPYNEAVENSEEITESVEVKEWKPVGNGGGVQSAEISKIKVLTQDEYEALGDDKDMTTLYIIKG